MAKVLFVHPDDVNLADVKALCARLGLNAVASWVIKRGEAYLADPNRIWQTSAWNVGDASHE